MTTQPVLDPDLLTAIARHARERPNHRACVADGRPLTYAQFHERIRAAQAVLVEAGLKPGVFLVVCRNLPLAWIWLLAARSLDCTTIWAPSLAYALALNNPDVTGVASDSPPDEASLSQLPAEAVIISGEAVERTLVRPAGEDSAESGLRGAHVMLSSGTTGFPKMIHMSAEVEHRAVVASWGLPGYGPEAVYYVSILPPSTAIGYRSVYLVWFNGGTIVFHNARDPWEPFRSGELTSADVTPGILANLLAIAPQESHRNDRMRLGIAGGVAPWRLVEQARERLTDDIQALYGSTEVGGVARSPLRQPEDTGMYWVQPERQARITDEAGQALPQGEIGLVALDTSYGTTGYWRDREASERYFRHGWFYPGDLGRLTPDGRLALQGRADEVIIYRGVKISPAPLEMAIQNQMGFTGVCILGEVDAAGDRLIVAIETSEPLPPEVEPRVRPRFPAGARLSFVAVPKLPRNLMDKVERRTLRAMLADAGV